jgi:DNA-binding MarR family transcriptional regulator
MSPANPSPAGEGAAEQPRWLAADELDDWAPLARLIMRLPAALDTQMRNDAGISHFEYIVLSRLSEAPRHTLRMSDLAGLANGSLSRLSHVVKRLESSGWIRREPCAEDGRFTNAILTKDGYAKVVASAPGHVETVRTLVIDALTAGQLRQLGDISKRILLRVDAAWPPNT